MTCRSRRDSAGTPVLRFGMRQAQIGMIGQNADFSADVRIIPHVSRFVKSEFQPRLRAASSWLALPIAQRLADVLARGRVTLTEVRDRSRHA
jgi:hypothetical protein